MECFCKTNVIRSYNEDQEYFNGYARSRMTKARGWRVERRGSMRVGDIRGGGNKDRERGRHAYE